MLILLLSQGDVYYAAEVEKRIAPLTETDIGLPVERQHQKIVICMQYCDHQM